MERQSQIYTKAEGERVEVDYEWYHWSAEHRHKIVELVRQTSRHEIISCLFAFADQVSYFVSVFCGPVGIVRSQLTLIVRQAMAGRSGGVASIYHKSKEEECMF